MRDNSKVTFVQNKILVELSKADNYYREMVIKFLSSPENCKVLRELMNKNVDADMNYATMFNAVKDLIIKWQNFGKQLKKNYSGEG